MTWGSHPATHPPMEQNQPLFYNRNGYNFAQWQNKPKHCLASSKAPTDSCPDSRAQSCTSIIMEGLCCGHSCSSLGKCLMAPLRLGFSFNPSAAYMARPTLSAQMWLSMDPGKAPNISTRAASSTMLNEFSASVAANVGLQPAERGEGAAVSLLAWEAACCQPAQRWGARATSYNSSLTTGLGGGLQPASSCGWALGRAPQLQPLLPRHLAAGRPPAAS